MSYSSINRMAVTEELAELLVCKAAQRQGLDADRH